MKIRIITAAVAFAAIAYSFAAAAQERLVKFEGGIGVIPVSSAAGVQNADGTFPDVNRNDVRGVPPGGQPWVISGLSVDVDNGRISVDGRGLLLAGGNGIGTNGSQSVQARLFCGAGLGVAHNSGFVPLEPNGDFRIDDILTPMPPEPCNNPALLIVNPPSATSPSGRWFAAGIPKQ